MRLFCLYGVADVSMSLTKWIRNAPSWLEVRLVDFPGHGLRSSEPLSRCSQGGQVLDEADLAAQRAALASLLTTEILAAAGDQPFALYGFSFGALLVYAIYHELVSRSAPLPLCVCVAGRGAPHCTAFSRQAAVLVSGSDTDDMLEFMEMGGFKTSVIPRPMRPRAAELFRMGMLLGAAPSAHGELSYAMPDIEQGGFTIAGPQHAINAPRVAACPIVAVGSDSDTVWPAKLVTRWREVAGDGGYLERTLHDVEHIKVMCHEQTMATCFMEIAACALQKVAAVGSPPP